MKTITLEKFLPEKYHVMEYLIKGDALSNRESSRKGFNSCHDQCAKVELCLDKELILKILNTYGVEFSNTVANVFCAHPEIIIKLKDK